MRIRKLKQDLVKERSQFAQQQTNLQSAQEKVIEKESTIAKLHKQLEQIKSSKILDSPLKGNFWTCDVFGYDKNLDRSKFCEVCGAESKDLRTEQVKLKGNFWVCHRCGYDKNPGVCEFCDACGFGRVSGI